MSAAAFEERYAADPDPWKTSSDPAEEAKRERTLAACGEGPFAATCELGCGIGVLTAELAARSRRLVALDAAPTAVAATTERLASWPDATAHVAVVPEGLPAGPFDLVVISELLYYLDTPALGAVLGWLEGALAPGGRVVAVHWTGEAPDLHHSADEVHEALAALPGLHHRDGFVAKTYRLDALEAIA